MDRSKDIQERADSFLIYSINQKIRERIFGLGDVIHTSGPAMSSGPQIHPIWPVGVETRDLGRDLGAG